MTNPTERSRSATASGATGRGDVPSGLRQVVGPVSAAAVGAGSAVGTCARHGGELLSPITTGSC